MNVLDILKGARDLVAEGRWAQGEFAQHKEGELCFCALGALRAAAQPDYNGYNLQDSAYKIVEPVMPALARHIPLYEKLDNRGIEKRAYSAIFQWNDHEDRTREDVVALFDRAIAAEEAEVPA